jgi:hypothetical protein
LEHVRAAALPQSPQVSRWPFPLSCLITTAGWLLREEALSSSSGKDYMLTIGLFLFPTAGHCAAKRRQHSWPLVYLAIPKTWTIGLLGIPAQNFVVYVLLYALS